MTGSLQRVYEHDDAGNVTNDGIRQFMFNNAGRMVRVMRTGVDASYVYSALGARLKKTVNLVARYFVYDTDNHLIGEYDANGAPIQEIVWLEDTPVAVLRANGVFYIHTDHLGTPRHITRPADNAIVWRWRSDPFGTAAAEEDPDGDAVTFNLNLRFAGQYYDAESGLHHNHFRDYDPQTGRYIEPDPLGLEGGANLSVANLASGRSGQLIQPTAVRSPSIVVESDHVAIDWAGRSDALQ